MMFRPRRSIFLRKYLDRYGACSHNADQISDRIGWKFDLDPGAQTFERQGV